MKKFLIVFTLVALALLGIGLAREPLTEWLVKWALARVDVELLTLEGLSFDRYLLTLNKLELRLAGEDELQTIEGLQLHYRVEAEGLSVQLHVAHLQLAPPARTVRESGEQPLTESDPLLLQPLLDTLWALPLDELRVDSLDVLAWSDIQVHWVKLGTRQQLDISREDIALRLRLQQEEQTPLLAWLDVSQGTTSLISVTGQLVEGGRRARGESESGGEGDGYAGDAGESETETETGQQWQLTATAQLSAGILPLLSADIGYRGLDGALTLAVDQTLPRDLRLWSRTPISVQSRLNLRASALTYPGGSMGQPVLRMRGRIDWLPPQLKLQIEAGRWWRSHALLAEGLKLDVPALSAVRPAVLQWSAASGAMDFSAPALQLLLPGLDIDPLWVSTTLQLSGFSASYAPGGDLVVRSGVSSSNIQLKYPQQWLPPVALDSTLSLRGSRLELIGELASDRDRRLLQMRVVHRLDVGSGQARLDTGTLLFGDGKDRLGQYFSHWPFAFDVRGGTGQTVLKLRWSSAAHTTRVSGDFRQKLTNISGFYGDVAFLGLGAEVVGEFIAPNYLFVDESAVVTLRSLDVGLPVDDIRLRFRGSLGAPQDTASERKSLHVQEFEATLFGGRVRAAEHFLLAPRELNFLTLEAEGLQVEDMLLAVGYESVRGTGSISARLPLRFEGNRVTMRKGRLEALAPGGVFRYQPAAGAEGGNAAMGLVERSLNNYHYTALVALADYNRDGDLKLDVRMDGVNPDMNQGQRIKLNLKLEDNIPMLLKSLQAGRRIEELVDQKIGGDH